MVHAAAIEVGRYGDKAETRQPVRSFAYLLAEAVRAVHDQHRRMPALIFRESDLADEFDAVVLDCH